MEQLKPGQFLTPEQVRNLPDKYTQGGVFIDVFYGASTVPDRIEVWGRNINGDRAAFSGATLDQPSYWNRDQWHSATLVSLPSAPSEPTMPDFDPHGLPEANNEIISKKLGQSPENATEPSPGEGYRWLDLTDIVQQGDSYSDDAGTTWHSPMQFGINVEDVKYHNTPVIYRRRIEPQAEVKSHCLKCGKSLYENVHALCGEYSGIGYGKDPTPRASSEIERRAAWALLHAEIVELHRAAAPNGIEYDCLRIVGVCRKVIEAESYARSIGAIE